MADGRQAGVARRPKGPSLSQSCYGAVDLGPDHVDNLLKGTGLQILIDAEKVSGGLGHHIGNRVLVGGAKEGILRFFGPIHLKPEDEFCGIELLEPAGKHDGSLDGRKYFDCPPGHGIFAPKAKVQLIAVTTISFTSSLVEPSPEESATPSPTQEEDPLNQTFDFTDSGIETSAAFVNSTFGLELHGAAPIANSTPAIGRVKSPLALPMEEDDATPEKIQTPRREGTFDMEPGELLGDEDPTVSLIGDTTEPAFVQSTILDSPSRDHTPGISDEVTPSFLVESSPEVTVGQETPRLNETRPMVERQESVLSDTLPMEAGRGEEEVEESAYVTAAGTLLATDVSEEGTLSLSIDATPRASPGQKRSASRASRDTGYEGNTDSDAHHSPDTSQPSPNQPKSKKPALNETFDAKKDGPADKEGKGHSETQKSAGPKGGSKLKVALPPPQPKPHPPRCPDREIGREGLGFESPRKPRLSVMEQAMAASAQAQAARTPKAPKPLSKQQLIAQKLKESIEAEKKKPKKEVQSKLAATLAQPPANKENGEEGSEEIRSRASSTASSNLRAPQKLTRPGTNHFQRKKT